MNQVLDSLPTASLIAAGVALLLGIIHSSRLPNHFRSDVPRWKREAHGSRGMPVWVWLEDLYTPEGDRCRRRMVGYALLSLALLAASIPSLGVRPLTTSSPGTFVIVALLITLVVLIALDIGHVMQGRGAERVVYELDDRGRVRAPSTPEPVEEYGPAYRERCACCGYPTVNPRDPYRLCHLCDWEEPAIDEEGDGATAERDRQLHEARKRFEHNLTVYDMTHPEPWMHVPPETERELKQAMIAEFERMKREGQLDDYLGWQRIFGLETQLASERDRAADEATPDVDTETAETDEAR